MQIVKQKGTVFGIILALTSAIATGTFGVFLNYFDSLGISENALSTFTPVVLFLFYIVVILVREPKSLILPKKRYYITLLLVSGAIVSPLYIFSTIKAFNKLPIAVASLLDFSNAIVLIFLMRIFFKEKITKEKIIASAAAIIGIMCVFNLFGEDNSSITSIGIFWGLMNCFSLAIAYVFDYFHIQHGVSYLAYLVYSNLMGIITFSFKCTPVAMIKEFQAVIPNVGMKFWMMLAGYALALIISYLTIAVSYKYIDASISSLTFVAEPTTAALLGFLVLGQTLIPIQIFGMVITIGAILYMQYVGSKKDKLEEQKRIMDQKILHDPKGYD